MLLTDADREELLTGKWLNDRLIHASQNLLKQDKDTDLPPTSLQNPLYGQMLCFRHVGRDDCVQILHSESHSVTVSTVGTQHPIVRVYNSLYFSLPVSTKRQISALLFTEEKAITSEWVNVQRQPNGNDWGLLP